MKNNKRMSIGDFHFITDYRAFIDEFRYNSKVMLIRAENPEIAGIAVVQGDERRGYEFLMLNDRYDFDDLGEELRENGFEPTMVELPDDRVITLQANFLINPDNYIHPTYRIDVDNERKILQIQCFESQSTDGYYTTKKEMFSSRNNNESIVFDM